MVQITYTLRLDMRDTGIINTSLRLKQGDSGMKIAVNVFNGGVSAFDSSTTPKIVFRRPDGASVMADMTVESSLYSYTLVGNELQVPGKELIDIKFPIGAEGRESTMSCSIEVVPDTITPNTHGSGIYDNDLAVLVEEATEAAETVQEVVGDSEAWADGTRGGVPVGPEDPAYHNNSKYWSEQANPTALANLTDVDVDGVANGDALQYNSSTQKWEGKSISSGTNEIIAPVEGATSLHAYAVGEQLIYNDTLYKVIAPIAVNDALVVNTNIEVSPKTVIEQVEDNAEGIEELNDAWKKNGAYNILPNNGTTSTVQGLVFTKNSDDTVTVGIGTATGDAYYAIDVVGTLSAILEAGEKYKLVGCPSGGGTDYYLYNGTSGDGVKDIGAGCEFTWSNSYNTGMFIYIKSGTVISSPLTFKPMITTDLNATYADYVPHAMTNRELTEVTDFSCSVASGFTSNFQNNVINGNIKILNLQLTVPALTGGTWYTVATVPSNAKSLTGKNVLFSCKLNGGNQHFDTWLVQNGNIQIRPLQNIAANVMCFINAIYI